MNDKKKHTGVRLFLASLGFIPLVSACTQAKDMEQYVDNIQENPAATAEISAEMSSELGYKYPAWLVTQNPDGRFNQLRGWLDDNTAINPDAVNSNCQGGSPCDSKDIPVGYVVDDSNNTIYTFLCEASDCSSGIKTVSTKATESAIDDIVKSAGGMAQSTIAFPGSRLENVLASGYTVRDFAVFAHNLNQGYEIDFLEDYIVNAKEVRIVSKEGCTDPKADTMLSIEYSDSDWIDFNMNYDQHEALLSYFAEDN